MRLKEHLRDHPANFGLLLLVDMGSLMNFSSDLQNELGIKAKTIPLVSTLHVLEATRKAALGYPLDYVYEETMHVNELLYESGSSAPVKAQLAKMFIVTICTTGEGSAALLKNILDSQLNYHNSMCETVTLRLTDIESIHARLNTIGQIGKILCLVSTFDVNFTAPHFGLTDVVEGDAISKIQKIIDCETAFEKISQTLSNMLKTENSEAIFSDIRSIINTIEIKSGRNLLPDVLVGVFCHIGCMVDRLVRKSSVGKFPHKETYIKQNQKIFNYVKEACNLMENNFSIAIPEDEIFFITSFFNESNCEEGTV